MAIARPYLGTDLRLLRDARRENSRMSGADLGVSRRARSGQQDLESFTERDNLAQALTLRLLTYQGELAPLGHPQYGSRLAELIGELNTERTRNRARLYFLEAIGQEPRVQKVLALSVEPNRHDKSRIDIEASLKIFDEGTPLNLVFPFFLQGEPRP